MSIKPFYLLIGILLVNIGFVQSQSENSDVFKADGVKKVWETHKTFKTPESVLYDEKRDICYVANMKGGGQDNDGEGFISRMGADGVIKDLKWVSGLNSPKGMAVNNGKLYVSDITELVVINIEKGKVVNKFHASESRFLNDVAVDEQGKVYVSDMYAHRIYRLSENELKAWSIANALNRPNGLYFHGGHLYVGNDDKLLGINVKDKDVNQLGDNTGSIDGLIALGDHRFLTTDWQGRMHLHDFSEGHDQKRLLDTREANQNAADMGFIHSSKKVLIPTFSDNRVMAYEVNIK